MHFEDAEIETSDRCVIGPMVRTVDFSVEHSIHINVHSETWAVTTTFQYLQQFIGWSFRKISRQASPTGVSCPGPPSACPLHPSVSSVFYFSLFYPTVGSGPVVKGPQVLHLQTRVGGFSAPASAICSTQSKEKDKAAFPSRTFNSSSLAFSTESQ